MCIPVKNITVDLHSYYTQARSGACLQSCCMTQYILLPNLIFVHEQTTVSHNASMLSWDKARIRKKKKGATSYNFFCPSTFHTIVKG